ncbi:MAG: hypothetical protein K6A35_07685 [bacterium]|nr:hypothetical protein [bacterium]
MNKSSQEIVEEFLISFPEYIDHYYEHIKYYSELLQHIFYSETINSPLFDLLKRNKEKTKILKYVSFIENMWSQGDDTVRNVVDVTILERLSDENDVWSTLGIYISEDFRNYINGELILQNIAMSNVSLI